ncbi:hypothetical protein J2W32_003490 [Variovorax boronicumulans]|uniref:DUF3617 domain-containing protein n=2 Tax=Variovorax TaxID=34072 RepID=A0AAW8D288_9BURK|nr:MULTISPECIES: DUF3617 family protein [Variovorax]ADU39655.1 hypothetical protein Varpa_5500 [Variovorax paradoxus EPS]MDP9894614.1 hypothetical protein [Variovorax boronicumulans]MDQ0054433.1 hypothetical protein [Variovorax boronicumulans]
MKIRSSVAAACMVAAGLGAGPAFALDYPARKPGLWEMQTSDGPGSKGSPQAIQQCIDAATDKMLRDMGQGMGKDMCSKQDMRMEGGKLVIDSVCKIGQTTATSQAVMTGDLSTAYRLESKSTYSPPLMGRAGATTVVEARWVGPCKPDQKPGDMVMNGMKMNVNDMMGARGKK